MTEQPPAGLRRHRFMGDSIDPSEELTEVQLDGRACVRCGAEDQPMRPVEAWSESSSQLFECVDVEACADRRGLCYACGHEWVGPPDKEWYSNKTPGSATPLLCATRLRYRPRVGASIPLRRVRRGTLRSAA
jgi:hypothetical protein